MPIDYSQLMMLPIDNQIYQPTFQPQQRRSLKFKQSNIGRQPPPNAQYIPYDSNTVGYPQQPQLPLKRERKPIIITDPNTHETINLKEKFQQKAEQTTTETQLKPDNKQSKATYSNPNINNQQQQNTTKLEYPIISKLAVLIENVSLDVLENILCFYESEKRTGGESIQKYKLNEKNGDLIIFYESQNVVARVLNFGLIIINKQFYKAVPYCKYFSFFYL
jgi:hypothetical protein